MSVPVYNIEGKKVNTLKPDKAVFDGKVNKAVLYQAVEMYQANRRQGTHSTKVCKEVRGGGRKPWRQKGTGRARAGSIRSPLWRGGGVVFGPHPRDYSYSLPKKVKKAALRYSLNAKFNDESIVFVDDFKLEKPKTKEFKTALSNLKVGGKALVVLAAKDENTERASRNIPGVTVKSAVDINAYDVLRHDKLVITEEALTGLVKAIADIKTRPAKTAAERKKQ